MILQNYSFFTKTEDGHRGDILNDVTSIDITWRWNEVTKWTLSGAGLSPCPLGKGSEIIVYRGSEPYLSGYVTSIEDQFDAASGIYDWRIEGCDDLGKLDRRVIYPDPSKADVQWETEYSAEGAAGDVLLDLIRRNISALADLPDRRIATLSTHSPEGVGETVSVASEYDTLLDFVLDQLSDGSLGIRTVWDGRTGVSQIQVYLPEDVSDTVVFSVEAGSLAGWTRRRTAPKGNVLLVTGCEVIEDKEEGEEQEEDEDAPKFFQTVIVIDEESVRQWGRYELKINHSDIKRIEEKDEETGEVIYREPWESVAERLRQAALTDLEANTAEDGYQLTIVELDRMQYKKHWDLGDRVSVRIAGTEFIAPIKEIRVTYAEGIETIVPSVGTLQKGELQSVFDDLGALKKQITILEKSNIINDELDHLEDGLVSWAQEYEEEDDGGGDEGGGEEPSIEVVAAQVDRLHVAIKKLRQNIIHVVD